VIREIMEELSLKVEVIRYFGSYTEPPFRVLYYLLRYVSGEISLVEHEQAVWLDREQLLDYDLLPGDIVIAQKLIHQSPKQTR
jgi:8-oxo-dGTP diphosphatase